MSRTLLKTIRGTDTWLDEACLLEQVPLSNFQIFWKWLRHLLPEPERKSVPVPDTRIEPPPVADFSRWIFPVIQNMPTASMFSDLVAVQSMTQPMEPYRPPIWKLAWWACWRAGHRLKQKWAFAAFLSQRKPGDQFWHFSTDAGSWMALAGRAGYVILRQHHVVGLWITRLS
jgi:hypothetical protein